MSCENSNLLSSSTRESVLINQSKKKLFPLLPLDVLNRIFNLIDFQSYVTCCLVSKGWKKLTLEDLEKRDIFKWACILLGTKRSDLKEEMKKKWGDQFEEYKKSIDLGVGSDSNWDKSEFVCSPYHQEINFQIPQLRVQAKVADAFLTTKGYHFSRNMAKINMLGRDMTEPMMIGLGVLSQITLCRLGLGNWDLNTIRKRLEILQDHADVFPQNGVKLFYKQMLFEFKLLDKSEQSLEFFESILPHIQDNAEFTLELAKAMIDNLCLIEKTGYKQAANFIEKHFKENNQIETLAVNLIFNAIKAKHFEFATNQILYFLKNEKIRSICFLMLLTGIYNHDSEKAKEFIHAYTEDIGNALLVLLIHAENKTDDQLDFPVFFHILSECFPVNDSHLKQLSHLIANKLKQKEINQALCYLWKNAFVGPFTKALQNILIKKCTELTESALHQALCSPSIVSDELLLELIEKTDSITHFKTLVGWQRSQTVFNLLLDKFQPPPDFLNWNLSPMVIKIFLKKFSGIDANGLAISLKKNREDAIILQMIEKLDVNSTCWDDYKRKDLDKTETYKYLKELAQNRSPEIQQALSNRYPSSCMIM